MLLIYFECYKIGALEKLIVCACCYIIYKPFQREMFIVLNQWHEINSQMTHIQSPDSMSIYFDWSKNRTQKPRKKFNENNKIAARVWKFGKPTLFRVSNSGQFMLIFWMQMIRDRKHREEWMLSQNSVPLDVQCTKRNVQYLSSYEVCQVGSITVSQCKIYTKECLK